MANSLLVRYMISYSAPSDRIGRRPVMLAGVMKLVDSKSPGLLILAIVLGRSVAQCTMYAPQGVGAGFTPVIVGSLVAANDGCRLEPGRCLRSFGREL